MLVNSLQESAEDQKKPEIFMRRLAGIEQVLSIDGRTTAGHHQRPVVVLAAAVDARVRLLVEQYREVMPGRDLPQDFHVELVMVRSDVGFFENGSELELAGSYFIMTGNARSIRKYSCSIPRVGTTRLISLSPIRCTSSQTLCDRISPLRMSAVFSSSEWPW